MQIRKIKWNNHPILGNLKLDLVNQSNDKPFDAIIFAGENGTGKTTILQTLSIFLNMGTFEYFDYIEFQVDGNLFRATQASDSSHKSFYDLLNIDNNETEKIRSDKSNSKNKIENNKNDIRHYGCIFSKARADYKTSKVTSTTTKDLDTDKYDLDEDDNYTSLKQLLVDIYNKDCSKYYEGNEGLGNQPKSTKDFEPSSKIYRFKNAFDKFFENLKYDKVADIENEKQVFFSKNDNSISIDDLSTGEKQIVFRGSYLLKNSNILDGSTILIDEPELSMHPKWQSKILQYYKDLFLKNDKQNCQLFFATHSVLVLKEGLADKDNTIIITLEDNGTEISSKKIDAPSVLDRITSAETSYIAFDLVTNDYHTELYGYLQEKNNLNSIKACDDYICNHQYYVASSHKKPSSHRSTTYNSLCTYIRNIIHHPNTNKTFDDSELRTSIELLIKLCS